MDVTGAAEDEGFRPPDAEAGAPLPVGASDAASLRDVGEAAPRDARSPSAADVGPDVGGRADATGTQPDAARTDAAAVLADAASSPPPDAAPLPKDAASPIPDAAVQPAACADPPLARVGANPAEAEHPDDLGNGCAQDPVGGDFVWRFVAPFTDRFGFTARQGDAPVSVAVREACDDPDSEFTCSPTLRGRTVAELDAQESVYVVADGVTPGEVVRLDVERKPPGTCDTPIFQQGQGELTGTTDQPGAEMLGEGSCGGRGAPRQVYRFSSTAARRWEVSVRASEPGYTPVVYVRTGCGEDADEIGCIVGAFDRLEFLSDAPFETFWIFVDGDQSRGRYEINIAARL